VIWRPDRIKKRETPSRCSIYLAGPVPGLRDAAHLKWQLSQQRAAAAFFEVAKVALQCQAHHYIHLSQQPTVANATPKVAQASPEERRHRPFRGEIGNDQSPSVYRGSGYRESVTGQENASYHWRPAGSEAPLSEYVAQAQSGQSPYTKWRLSNEVNLRTLGTETGPSHCGLGLVCHVSGQSFETLV
jgi:hypothetical protein